MSNPSTSRPDPPTNAFPAPVRIPIDRISFADSDLGPLLAALDGSEGIETPLDTEADSFHHYFEKVCLLQLAVDGHAWLVDPLVDGVNLAPLFSRLAKRPLLLHGADYDLRLLHRGHGFAAASVFDTMFAAQLLGEKEIGLAALLVRRVGVALDKANQRDDWSERPLSPIQVAYAAADVLFLPALVDSLRTDLVRAGRLDWHREECERLLRGPFDGRERDPENDWRLKGTNAFSSVERAFVRALWEAREARARELDRPPFRILTNERLLHGARLAAAGEPSLERLFPGKPLPSPFEARVREALRRARELPPEAWPDRKRGMATPPDPALEKEVNALKARRDLLAEKLGMDPGVVASRALLTAAARLRLESGRLDAGRLVGEAGFTRWRAELLAGQTG